MCGFGGVYGTHTRGELEAMSQRLQHRGPDGDGLFSEGPAGLVHRRLAIIDPSPAGLQPMEDVSGRLVVAFNGELYGYREQRARLQAAGFPFRTDTDTEVLLNLYLERGPAMLPTLDGMFAFALWDRHDRTLLLARDALGIKPLYLGRAGTRLAFASELKALLALDDLPLDLDLPALRDYLTYLWCPAPRTPLTAVRKLEPGHALQVSAAGSRTWRFRGLPAPRRSPSPGPRNATARVQRALDHSVRRQLVADVPVGAFLSGGVDSTGVVGVARRVAPHVPLTAFTIRCDPSEREGEGVTDDLRYARLAARHYGLTLHEVDAPRDLGPRLPWLIYHLDEPTADPAGLNVWAISECARQHGIKVLLSGAGGDDVFGGYRRHQAVWFERLWSWWPKPLRHGLGQLARRLPQTGSLRRVHKALADMNTDAPERLVRYFHWSPAARLDAISLPAFRQAARLRDDRPLHDSLLGLEHHDPLQRALLLDQRHFLGDHNLNYTDKLSMAAGVEVRVPLLDHHLLDAGASLPSQHKVRGLSTKRALRWALRRDLPPEVLRRPKTGFGVPLRTWLEGPLRPALDTWLDPDRLRRRGLIDPAATLRLRERTRAGHVDGAWTLFALMCLEVWLHVFLDQRGTLGG